MDVFNSAVNARLGVLDYPIASQLLKLFLVLYGGLAAPQLPLKVSKWFSNTWFRIGFMSLIAWNANRDPALSIILAAVYCLSLYYATNKALTQVATTGQVTPEVTVVVSGGSGPSIKPASAVVVEEQQIKAVVAVAQQEAKAAASSQAAPSFKVVPQATMSPVSGAGAGSAGLALPVLPRVPSGVPISETALSPASTSSVPQAFQSTSHASMAEVAAH